MKVLAFLLLISTAVFAQNTDSMKYATRQVLLVDPAPGTVPILPMMLTVDGKQQLTYVPADQIRQSLEKGGRPITLADIFNALGAATERANQLQAENERLWKIAGKDAPQTVVVQEPQGPSQSQIEVQQQDEANARRQQAIQTWIALQNANRAQNVNVYYSNCTRLPALCIGH